MALGFDGRMGNANWAKTEVCRSLEECMDEEKGIDRGENGFV